ncbi:autotransporter outer membrane beta-barrel domain-containing protein [Erwinia endophytica]|uniref:autotransporter outer membrane beta-barrel domain-containing protein n=1 Tax=Erwinia endophytica TaxID=1563158 RepID=UPI001265F0A6|nr:autotransporter outer membrane beta-barrel domain-containing protein [Erwinia endophytica]KAB8312452.1 autotransporter outer membrane beta-barrel domain-containing protein [Erwinia endophytica]
MTVYTRPFALNVLTLALFPLCASAISQWSETSGNTLQVTSGYSTATSQDYPLYASGANSQLVTDSGLLFSTTANGTYAAYLTDHASLELNNATLYTTGSSASGISVIDSTLTMTGGTITTTGSQAYGIIASNADLTLDDVTILPGGQNAYGIKMTGGTLSATDVIISSSAAIGGITLSNGASATLDDVDINLLNSSGFSAITLTDSSLVGNNVNVISNVYSGNGGTAAVRVGTNSSLELTDSTITSAAIGIRTWSNSDTTLTNVDVTTSGDGSHAIDINQANANVTINGGSYLTQGAAAYGVWLIGSGSTLEATDATFQTEGSSSHAITVQNGTAVLTDSTLTTSGEKSYGLYAGSTVDGSGVTITTSGSNAYGVMAVYSGGQLTLTDSTITTAGQTALGLAVTGGGGAELTDSVISTSGSTAYGVLVSGSGSATLQNTAVTTTGDNAYGIAASGSDAVIDATDSTLSTSGDSAYAVLATAGSTVSLTDSTISTSGDLSGGLYALSSSTINADGITIDTSGEESYALATSLSSTLNISNSQLTTRGAAAGLIALGKEDDASNTVTLDNVSLTSEQGTGVIAQGTSLDLNLKNGTTVYGGNGVALSATSSTDTDGNTTYSDVDIIADGNVSLLGDVVTDSYANAITLSLTDNSTLTGATQNVSQLLLDSTSRWLITGNSSVDDLQQDGLVTFSSSSGFSTLTVDGDLTGSGTFVMNTQLGDDSSPTDQLLVTGNASGSFGVTINNKGGLGAATDTGILLIQVSGDAQSATFTQNNSVVAGNYEYFLNQVDGNSWYLQSSYTSDDNGRDDDDTKTWRPEVAGYLIAPYLNAAYGFTSAGTYHQRLGATKGNDGAWGRIYGRHDNYSAGRFAFDVNTAFIQLGGDLLQKDLADNWHISAGPTMTFGRQHSSNKDNARSARQGLSVNVGKMDTTAYSVGGYVTTWNDDGSYLDTVGQVTRYSNHFKSLTDAKMNSYAALLSVEAGKPFKLVKKLSLEPQVQFMGQYMNISQTYASGVKMEGQNLYVGQVRGGFRLFYDDPVVQPYVNADVIQQLGATPGVDMNGDTLSPDVRKGMWRTSVGVSGKVTRQLNLYAEASYSHSFGPGYEGYTGNLGVKYQF